MPCLSVTTNRRLSKSEQKVWLENAGARVAQMLGKTEHYLFVVLNDDTPLRFGASEEPAVLARLESLGLPTHRMSDVASQLTSFLSDSLGVSRQRITIIFESPLPAQWSVGGDTLG